MKRYLIRAIPYLILFAAGLFPFWVNISTFSKDGIFNLRDFNLPFDIRSNFKQMLFVWNYNLGFGFPNFSPNLILVYHIPLIVFRTLGFSLLNSEKLYLSLVLFLVGLGSYCFLNYYFRFPNEGLKKTSALIGSLFYMFNLPLNNRFIGVPHAAIVIGLFPIMLILADKILYSKSFRSSLVCVLLLPFLITFSIASDLSVFYMFFLTICCFVILNLIINFKLVKKANLIYCGLIIAITSFLLNSFWLFPNLGDYFKGKSYYKGIIGSDYNTKVFNKNYFYHDSPLDIIRLHWGKDSFDVISMAKENYYPSLVRSYYHLPVNTILFFALLAFGLFVSFQNKENKRQVLMMSSLGIVGCLFSFGGKSPLEFWRIHQFLFEHFPGFSILRTFLKFQDLQLFWYVCLVMFLAYWLLEKCEKRYLRQVAIVVLSVIFIIQGALPWFLTNLAGRLEFFVLPDYYWQAKNWLDEQGEDFRFIVFPQGEWTETYEWGPKFELVPIYRNFFTQPSLYQEPEDASGTKPFIEPLENFEIANPASYLKFMGVKSVLVRKDIVPASVYPPFNFVAERMPQYLETNGYKLVKSFGDKLFFYQLEEENFLPEVFVAEKVKYLSETKDKVKYLFDYQDINEQTVILSKEDDLNKEAIGLSSEKYYWMQLSTTDSAYTVDLLQQGNYQLVLRPSGNDRLIDYKKASSYNKDFFVVGRKSDEFSSLSVNKFWWNFGHLDLPAGKNTFRINSQRVNLVNDQNWKLQKSQDGVNSAFIQQINNWTPNYQYRISFDYLTEKAGVSFAVIEQKYKMTKEMYEYTTWQEQLLGGQLAAGVELRNFDQVVKSSSESIAAAVVISNGSNQTKITNLMISPVFQPLVFLKSTDNSKVSSPLNVSFKKINPTKFEVNVENISRPFILVLNNAFNKNWAAETDKGRISAENHLLINGFANGWLLKPEEFSGTSGIITLEFILQEYLFKGTYVSASTAVLMLILLPVLIIKKRKASEGENS